jgi:hypothetical protein
VRDLRHRGLVSTVLVVLLVVGGWALLFPGLLGRDDELPFEFRSQQDGIPSAVEKDGRTQDNVQEILIVKGIPGSSEFDGESESSENIESDPYIEIPDEIREISVWGLIGTDSGAVSAFSNVVLFSLGKRKTYRTLSDELGYFSFENVVPARDYLVRVTPYGMYQQYIRYPVILNFRKTALSIELTTLKVASLKGEIVNTDNRPVSRFGIKVKNAKKSQ